ncbi:MAG: hypothetical protein ACREPQ_09765 [Rhodanobacter sp.]
MAAIIKAAINAIPGLTEERLGELLGVSQGQVSHWTGARLPVAWKRAADLAAAIGIEDPASISVAYREVMAKTATQQQSHVLRHDLEIIRDVAQALRDTGLIYEEDMPNLFVKAYERALTHGDYNSRDNMGWLSRQAKKSMPQGASHDVRSTSSNATSVSKRTRGPRARKA